MPQNILDDLKFRFETLQKSADQFSVKQRLSSAQAIRDEITNDEDLNNLCNTNQEISSERTALLGSIKTYIDTIIDQVVKETPAFNANGNEEVQNYSEAKEALINIVDTEQNARIDDDINNFLSAIPEWNTHIATLETVKKHCDEGRFSILLMGEFQSGKTTTIDALCDGRHIGKIGDGNATTAIPMSVSYSDKENIAICWKTTEELHSILSGLAEYIEDFSIEKIDNAESRQQWMEKIESLRTSEDYPEDIRPLAVMSLILNYYGTTTLVENQERKYSLSDISQLSCFPNQFANRWRNGGASAFSIDEALFAFIDHIDCRTASSTLKELNCAVFDCPGLFHNQYDTNITIQLMAKVNAIVFILPYHKKGGEDVLKTLKKIKYDFVDVQRKLFITQNVSLKNDNNFVSEIISEVKQLFGNEKEVFCYDANLAYLGKFNQLWKENRATEDDIKFFCKPVTRTNPLTGKAYEISFKSVEEAMQFKLRGYPEDIDKNNLIKESGIESLIEALRSFIENNAAYSLIFSDGINKMHTGLALTKSTLFIKCIEPYKKKADELSMIYEKRIEDIQTFTMYAQTKISAIFNDNTGDSLKMRLTNAIHNKLFTKGFYSDVSRSIARLMYEKKFEIAKKGLGSQWAKLRNGIQKFLPEDKRKVFNVSQLKDYIQPLVKTNIADNLKNRINYWNSIVSKGEDTSFKEYFDPQMRSLELNLYNEWLNLFGQDTEYKDAMNRFIRIPRNINDFNLQNQHEGNYNIPVDVTSAILAALDDIMITVGGIIGGITAAIVALLLAGTSNPVGWVFLAATGVVAVILTKQQKEKAKEDFIDTMSQDILNKMKENDLDSTLRNNLVTTCVSSYLKVHSDQLNSQKNIMTATMENDRDLALNTPENERELNCFKAAAAIDIINARLKDYSSFKEQYSTNGKA